MADQTYTLNDFGNTLGNAATGVKNQLVNLFAPSAVSSGDYSAQAAEYARQQKMADLLSQMGAQDIPVSTAGGITAPISPWAALAKGLESGAGAYMGARAAGDQAAVKKAETADALAQIGKLYTLPDTTGLVPSTAPAGTTSTPFTVGMPTLPGQKPSNVSATANLDLPNAPGVQTATIPGGARPYADQLKMLNKWAIGDNAVLAAAAPTLAAQLKPTYMEQAAGSTMYKDVNGVVTPTGNTTPPPLNEEEQRFKDMYGPYYKTNPNYLAFLNRKELGIKSPEELDQAKTIAEAGAARIVNRELAANTIPTGPNGMALGVTGDSAPHPEAPGYSTKAIPQIGLTQARLDQAALYSVLHNGAMPSLGLGSSGPTKFQRTAIQNRAAEMDPGGNLAANGAQTTALSKELDRTIKDGTTIATNLYNAKNEGDQIFNTFAGKINDQTVTLANVIANAAKYNLDPGTVSAYKGSLRELGTTYNNIFARSGRATDLTRKQGQDIADGNISLSALKTAVGQINDLGEIVVKGFDDQRTNLQGQFNNIVSGKPSSFMPKGGAAAPGAGGAAAPGGAGGPRLTAEQAAKLPPDTAFVGMDGVARRTHK
jgi:hypothetical protein